MTGALIQYALLIVCWISALVTLVIFLESWFALTRRSRLGPRRSTDSHGVVSVVIPVERADEAARHGIASVFEQSYPFIELVLVYNGENDRHRRFVEEFGETRSHIPLRGAPVPFALQSETARIRALEFVQPALRGSWILVSECDIVMDTCAVESALEFAGSEEISAVAMIPGVECRSLGQRLLAPSLEWFVRMLRALDRGKEKASRLNMTAPFLLLHGQTHSVLNKMNRMPGILNEAGWTLWSYKVEGLRTFQGDGTGWISREGTVRSLLATLDPRSLNTGRVVGFGLASAAITIVSVVGIVFGILSPDSGFSTMGILYFSAFAYSLMATSYFFYARRLGAAVWFAPFWFLSHSAALVLAMIELVRSRPSLPAVTVPSRSPRREVSTRADDRKNS
jgi:hypothetical protein